jgi:hypothetical protein
MRRISLGTAMSDKKIQRAIDKYLQARHELIVLARKHPGRIGGNDNIIGRIGEFIALRFLERRGQRPLKISGSSNRGYDLVENNTRTQVKVITEENRRGRSVRLVEPWTQLLLIELGKHYRPIRIGVLTKRQHQQACSENAGWSLKPIVRRSMLGPRGLISRYGCVYQGEDIVV